MPRRRSARRSNGSTIRRATNQYWIDAPNLTGTTITGGAPQAFNLLSNLGNDYSVMPKGSTILAVRGSITAFATTTAAAANAYLTAGIVTASGSTPVAQLDPTTVAGRQRHWMWQTDWPWPLTTPAAIAGQYVDARREVVVKSRRIMADNDEALFLVLGSAPTASVQTFQTIWHLRVLCRVP